MKPGYDNPLTSLTIKMRGYSLVELMIAIVLALFLTAGLLGVFISSQRATNEVLGSGERQESAAFALQLLAKDLKQVNFFSLATGENTTLWNLNGAAIAASNDCLDEATNGSFPKNNQFRPLWASSIPVTLSTLEMDCLDDGDSDTSLVINSDYISIKRVRGFKQSSDYITDRFYLDIDTTALNVYQGGQSALTAISAWEYMHHVYYLDSFEGVNRLRRLTLRASEMVLEEVLVEGVENMQFMFALDDLIASERDGSVNSFVGTSQVTANDWNTGRVIGIKIFLLVKSLEKTVGYVNSNIYQLGDYVVAASNDNYKRELASVVVLFQNSVVLVND